MMNNKTVKDGACCLPSLDGVTYLQIGPKHITIGLMRLEKVFEELLLLKRTPAEASDEELVGMARKRKNYIPDQPSTEAEYGDALRKAYAAFYARREKSHE